MRFDICKNPAFMQSGSTRKQRSNKWYIQTLEDNTTISTDYADIMTYSFDGVTYLPMDEQISIPNAGQKIYFTLGVITEFPATEYFRIIDSDKVFSAHGNLIPFEVDAIYNGKRFNFTTFEWFRESKIEDASDLVIDISDYQEKLILSSAFKNCRYLKYAPKLPCLSVPEDGYRDMFNNCTSLITAPDLPATDVVSQAYSQMFRTCTSLTKSGIIMAQPSNTMFWGCSLLSNVTCLAQNINPDGYGQWLNNVSPTGTFIKAAGAEWPTGVDGIPEGWTVQDYAG